MLTWGLILAKLKAGLTASANSKDHQQVQSSWKRVVTLIIVVGIVSFAKVRIESDSTSPVALQTSIGRALQTQNIDYSKMLQDSINEWRTGKDSKLDSKKLASTEPITAQSSTSQKQLLISSIKLKIQSMASWVSGLFFLGFCYIYVSTFRSYKNAVERHNMLTELFKDPNVRVASGE